MRRPVPSPEKTLAQFAPAVIPLIAVAALLFLAVSSGGLDVTDWLPTAILAALLLATTGFAQGLGLAQLSRPLQVAIGAFALFTAWTFLSITWSVDKGMAWDGANRQLFYLTLFVLGAVTARGTSNRTLIVGAWTLGIILLAAITLIWLPQLPGGRDPIGAHGLQFPIEYPNGSGALWGMAVWPALALALDRQMVPVLRPLFGGGAVLLLNLVLASQSRGALFATALTGIIFVLVMPRRTRLILGLIPVAAATALTAQKVLDSGKLSDAAMAAELGRLSGTILLAGLLVALFFAVLTAFETQLEFSPPTTRAMNISAAVAATALLVVGVGISAVAIKDPGKRVSDAVSSFKNGAGANNKGALGGGLGGSRDDYLRVGMKLFGQNAVAGVGADNFGQRYLKYEKSSETPSYAHSIQVATLSQLGIVGAGLLLTGLLAALGAALVAAYRQPDAVGFGAICGAIGAVLYWLVHGSADWLAEIPALGGAAFLLLGVGGASLPAPRNTAVTVATPARSASLRPALLATGAIATALAVLSFALPWLSRLEINRALAVWRVNPTAADKQLDWAAKLNPLSNKSALNKGAIAVEQRNIAKAKGAFSESLKRHPESIYALAQLGAIASQERKPAEALGYFQKVLAVHPGDVVARTGADRVKAGLLYTPRQVNLYLVRAVESQGR